MKNLTIILGLLIATIIPLTLTSCSTTQFAQVYESVQGFIKPGVKLACAAVIQSAQSDQDKIDKANYIYGVAKGIYTLTGAGIPSPEQVDAVINSFLPDKAHWDSFRAKIVAIYRTAYITLKDNEKLVQDLLTQIAQGCEESAKEVTANASVAN